MKKVKEIQDKKLNARLYPIYKMISWDLLFYYSIIYLFLVQAKGFSSSQVLLGDAFFTAACLILQIPLGLLVDKIGKKNSLVLANISLCIFTLILLIVNNYTQLLMAFLMFAIGYVIKGICETNILYDSLPRGKKRGGLYSAIDGAGTARYYVIDAITSLTASFAFVISPYLPIILCLICNIIATILSTRFRHTHIPGEEDIRTGSKEYFGELKEAIKFTFTSKRMLCLMIFFALVTGLNYNLTTFRSGILEQIKLPEQYFGIVFALIQIAAAICSGMQKIIHKKFRNRTLTFLGIPMTTFLILIGLLATWTTDTTSFTTYIIISLFVILGGVKGAHNVLTYRYLNNFTNKNIRTKLATIRNMIYNIFTILISVLGAFLLEHTDASIAIMIIGGIATIILLLLLHYMKDKVGLSPENYSDEDLKYSHLISMR